MRNINVSIHPISNFTVRSILFEMVVLTTIFLFASCGGSDAGDSVILELAPSNAVSLSGEQAGNFDFESSVVLRCDSVVKSENELAITTSKSKTMEASTLIFIEPVRSRNHQTGVQLIISPIVGEEYEYDMTEASYYTVTLSSVEYVIETYGIPFPDWQIGACSSEQFPCCE